MTRELASPDSTITFRNSQGELVRATLVGLSRHTIVMEVYNPYSIVQLSEVLHEVRIMRGEHPVYMGRAAVTNFVSTGLLLVVSASLIDPWSDIVHLSPGPALRHEADLFVQDWSECNRQLRPSYQTAVNNLRNFLAELKRWMDHSEAVMQLDQGSSDGAGHLAFLHDIDISVRDKFAELLAEFETQAQIVEPEHAAIHKAYCQRELHPLVLCAPFLHRSFVKPLGYAGDYMMVRLMLEAPYQGPNSFARLLNSIAVQSATAQAHRNRIDELVRVLIAESGRVRRQNRPFRFLNVGCGPAVEVQRFLRESPLSDYCQAELMDFNQETLDYAEKELRSLADRFQRRIELRFVHRSVHDLLKQTTGRLGASPAEFDLVYCAGLFDYLGDRICRRLVQLFYDWVLPGGLVLCTNVHSRQPERARMEHLQEWYLVLRDEPQMLDLAPPQTAATVDTEPLGVNVFLRVRRPEPTADEP